MTDRVADRAARASAADLPRRRFFGRVITAIAAVVAAAWAVPLGIYAVAPALKRRIREWADAGAMVDLDVDRPRELDVVVSRRDGWQEVRAVKSFWAYRAQDGEVVAFSAICPHLGCAFQWQADERRFVCPCHRSVFSLSGEVVSGPAPRPLDRLDVKVENGRLLVLPQDFKSGVRQKIPI
jgi:menaquinol-cytochrome c reductase iron-sulfur subunit